MEITGFLIRFTDANWQYYFTLVWDRHSSKRNVEPDEPHGSDHVTGSTWCHRTELNSRKSLCIVFTCCDVTKISKFIWNPHYFCQINSCVNIYHEWAFQKCEYIYIYIKLGTNSWYAWDGRLDLKWRRWKFWPFNKNRFKLVNCQLPHIFYFPNFSSGNILPRKMKHFNNVSSIFVCVSSCQSQGIFSLRAVNLKSTTLAMLHNK